MDSPHTPHTSPGDDSTALRRLAAAACEGPLGPAEVGELERLLADDLFATQQYLGYTQIHSSLLQNRERVTAEGIWERVERDLFAKPRVPSFVADVSARGRLAAAAAVVMASLAALLVVGFWPAPPVVGRVVAVSEGADWNGPALALGDVIRRGDAVGLARGLVTVELRNDVTVDLVGPVASSFTRGGDVDLEAGTVAAAVGPAGRGFAVRTDDADVVDFGTRFLVGKDATSGTHVRVDVGLVEARLKDRSGNVASVLDLVAGQSGRLDAASGVAAYAEGLFDFAPLRAAVEAKGDVRRFSGAARPYSSALVGLDTRPGETVTRGRVVILPEAEGVELAAPLTVGTPDGPVTLPSGVVLDAYLCHYDIGVGTRLEATGRGGMSFTKEVVAVVSTADGLAATDALFANAGTRFTDEAFRGLEDAGDVVSVSADRVTVLFDLEAQPGRSLDQFRVLVRGTPR